MRLLAPALLLFLARVVVVAVNFLLIPLYLHYLGLNIVGLMALLANLTSLFMIFDVGISTQATVHASKFLAGHDRAKLGTFLRSGEYAYWLIGLCIAVGFYSVIRYWPNSWVRQILADQNINAPTKHDM